MQIETLLLKLVSQLKLLLLMNQVGLTVNPVRNQSTTAVATPDP
ncbi:hypothetical protein HanOQP8_Chr02g0054001 [Helianthus annuus]|nr:hypothetical protein HanOQP8_Chr02g0054001 [Helianthus annuus]